MFIRSHYETKQIFPRPVFLTGGLETKIGTEQDKAAALNKRTR